tara:strand:- start:5108 stop:5215 length:108 start_codon:yes stop_codon:yes gene_type:complete
MISKLHEILISHVSEDKDDFVSEFVEVVRANYLDV